MKMRLYAVLLIVCTLGLAAFVYQTESNPASKWKFHLGLDLKGGTELVYKADISKIGPAQVADAMSSLRDVIEKRVNLFGVSEPVVQVEQAGIAAGSGAADQRLIVELPGVTDVKQAVDLIGKTPLLDFRVVTATTTATIKDGKVVAGEPVTKEVYAHQIAFNVLPQVDSFLPSGYTKEEMKMENEGRKIMHHPAFRASVTCVRVPVYRAHSVAISAEFEKPVTVETAREVFSRAPGLDIVDTPEKAEYPLPLYVAEKDNCQVGRIRKDCAMDNGLCFWVCGDQLLKGAALNAVQIAEELLKF